MEQGDAPIPISALQHAVYCLRQAALIHLERVWVENRLTAEGRVLHQASDMPGERLRGGCRVVTALPLASVALNLTGVADRVEFIPGGGGPCDDGPNANGPGADSGEIAYPVEYKRGKPKPHRADEVQLCAQALCLEEMTGRPVPEGALFYAEPRRRLAVPFDETLRALTRETIAAFDAVLRSRQTPPAVYRAGKCRACSLLEPCRPKLAKRSARSWRDARLAEILSAEAPSGP